MNIGIQINPKSIILCVPNNAKHLNLHLGVSSKSDLFKLKGTIALAIKLEASTIIIFTSDNLFPTDEKIVDVHVR